MSAAAITAAARCLTWIIATRSGDPLMAVRLHLARFRPVGKRALLGTTSGLANTQGADREQRTWQKKRDCPMGRMGYCPQKLLGCANGSSTAGDLAAGPELR